MSTLRSLPPRTLHMFGYALLAIVLSVSLLTRGERPLPLAARTTADPARAGSVQSRLDPNTASWSELAALPGIGESLAKRIVAARQPAPSGPGLVFRKPADLDAVKGIGPRLIERIQPWLRFPRSST